MGKWLSGGGTDTRRSTTDEQSDSQLAKDMEITYLTGCLLKIK